MNQVNIKLCQIRSVEIIHIPSITVTGRQFRFANIARVRTADGGDYDLLFDERGQPLVDRGLMERVGAFYEKKFVGIVFDGQPAYAELHGKAENATSKQTAVDVGKAMHEGSSCNRT